MMKTVRFVFALACAAALTTNAQWVPFNHPGYQSIFSVTTTPGTILMVSASQGVIKSTDGGSAWNPANTGMTGSTVESVYYNNVSLFSGTHVGVYKSTDNAVSWTLSNTNLPTASAANCVKQFFHYNGTTFAVYNGAVGSNAGGIWRSTDEGANWFSGNGGLSSNMIIGQIAQMNGVLYAATTSGLYQSTNLGVGWTA
ncbi:MAG TPA: sialidase family protein, partial [Flavobacteriales bacterium]|nr:sialidase family protein [Flavobacteriales bacterium]